MVEGTGGDAALHIKVIARGDWEEFSSVDSFLEEVTPQAMSRFSRLTIVATGKEARAEVLMARKDLYEFPFEGTRGIVVQTQASGGSSKKRSEQTKAMCDRLRLAVRRGSFPWTRGLRVSETRPRTLIAEQLRLQGGRRKVFTRAAVTALASLPFWFVAALEWAGVFDDKDYEGMLTYLVIAQCLIFASGAPLAGVVMPAIEVAELTPGRRALRLIGRSGLLSGATSLIAAFIKVRAGLSE